jgi:hypothetical protein
MLAKSYQVSEREETNFNILDDYISWILVLTSTFFFSLEEFILYIESFQKKNDSINSLVSPRLSNL